MSEMSQFVLMAEYNQLMNQRLFNAASNLSSEKLFENKRVFFKSIIATLNHIMIGDILWLERFSKHSRNFVSLKNIHKYAQVNTLDQLLYEDFEVLTKERELLDQVIIDFCNEINEEDINSNLNYMNFKKEDHNKRFGYLILHVFLHQIHHRGQVTTLLSQENIDFGETDIPEIVLEENIA